MSVRESRPNRRSFSVDLGVNLRPDGVGVSSVSKSPPDVTQERRKQILRAAVEVFAEKGFHRTRVSDVARQAGVAYGLIYHYFESKDALLNSIFEENWAVFLKVLDDLKQQPELSAVDRLFQVAELLIDALQVVPTTIQVIIQEVSRSGRFVQPGKLQAFESALTAIEDIICQGQAAREIDPSTDRRVMAHMFMGALETVCTGVVIGQIACDSPEDSEVIKETIRRVLTGGMRTTS